MTEGRKLFALTVALCALPVLIHFGLRQKSELPQHHAAQTIETPSPQVTATANENSLFAGKSDDDLFFLATNAAAISPETALAIGKKFLANDPNDDNARASNLVLALCSAGNFQTAIDFANSANAGLRDNWLKVIFSRWTQTNPQNAMSALDSISDSSARKMAFETAADTWARENPSAFADFTGALLGGDEKTYALQKTVEHWSFQDPAGFSVWLNTSPTGVDLDHAIAEMISKTDGANRSPEVAMQWIDAMTDPALKINSVSCVLAEWNQADPVAAQNYAAKISWLDDNQRAEILKQLQKPPPSIAETAAND
jgi:hypothetical protein